MLPFRAALFSSTAIIDDGSDPYFSSVSLLVGDAGVDFSSFNHSPSFLGAASTSTNPITGTSSIHKTTTSGKVNYDEHTSLDLDAGPWTIEGFFKWGDVTQPSPYAYLIAKWFPTGNQRSFALIWNGDFSPARLTFWYSDTGSVTGAGFNSSGAFSPVINTTYHIAVDYDGTKLRMYVNGTLVGSSTQTVSIFNGTSPTTILGRSDGAVSDFPTASTSMCDEVRITKGVARYASDSGFANFVVGNAFEGWPRG